MHYAQCLILEYQHFKNMKGKIKRIIRNSDGSITTVDYNRNTKNLKLKKNEHLNRISKLALADNNCSDTRNLRTCDTINSYGHQLQFPWYDN